MGIISKKLGQRIKELRESKNISQLKLAEELNMEASNLSKIERGIQIPKEESLIKLANALNVSIKDLFDYDHFIDKEELINKINLMLKSVDTKTLQKYYKILMDLQ